MLTHLYVVSKKKKERKKPKTPKPRSEFVDTENRLVVARD